MVVDVSRAIEQDKPSKKFINIMSHIKYLSVALSWVNTLCENIAVFSDAYQEFNKPLNSLDYQIER